MLRPRSLLALAIALVALAGTLLSVEYGRVTREFYSGMVRSEGRAVRDRLNLRLSPPVAALTLTAKLLSRAAPDRPTLQDTRALLLTTLGDEQSLDAATLLDGNGVAAMAARDKDGYLYYQRPVEPGAPKVWQRLGADLAPGGDGPDASPDAAAMRAVVEASLRENHRDNPSWTGAHQLPGRHAAAVSAVLPAGPNGGPERALAFSFALDRTLEALRQGLPEDARIVVCSPGGSLLDPGGAGAVSAHATFTPVSQVADPVLSGTVRTWLERSSPVDDPFGFQVAGKDWWACLLPLYGDDSHTYAGLAVSGESLVALLWRDNRTVAAVAASLLAALILLAALLVVIRRRAQSGPGPFFETPESVRELIDGGESDRLEFKSTLRFNLAAGKPGKEIELATLKTVTAFLNTDGGVLAVGVDDQGHFLGLDADGFENDDHLLRHFSSLFAQHVGVEHLRDVTFALREVDGRKVLLVECRKSREPVILKSGKEEEFYVRAGPSSRRLSLSEFMRRVTGRDTGGA